ncbi:Uncharacterized conserved protein YkwD, contains CAP (CSP/antigen 5/PR1) domain [Frankineae bacterium MT45]|nr:Uncharacterized conserved protein YkwD, contains CAP (CSP/antigen 5/PR1) domain [Frankineae bacterium MT45]
MRSIGQYCRAHVLIASIVTLIAGSAGMVGAANAFGDASTGREQITPPHLVSPTFVGTPASLRLMQLAQPTPVAPVAHAKASPAARPAVKATPRPTSTPRPSVTWSPPRTTSDENSTERSYSSPKVSSPVQAAPKAVVRAVVPAKPKAVVARPATKPAAKPAAKPAVKASSVTSSSSIAYSVLSRLNSDRARYGVPALRMSGTLTSAAHHHNLAMAAANVMSHQVSGEAGLAGRLAAVGYGWNACAENIGWSTDESSSGALDLDSQMMAEVAPNDGHRVNILNTKYTQVGIDVVLDSATGKLWLTEDFGQPG